MQSELESQEGQGQTDSADPRSVSETEAGQAALSEAVLDELEMFVWTGQLPGGSCWSKQVWWRVDLWKSYWESRDEEILRVSKGWISEAMVRI